MELKQSVGSDDVGSDGGEVAKENLWEKWRNRDFMDVRRFNASIRWDLAFPDIQDGLEFFDHKGMYHCIIELGIFDSGSVGDDDEYCNRLSKKEDMKKMRNFYEPLLNAEWNIATVLGSVELKANTPIRLSLPAVDSSLLVENKRGDIEVRNNLRDQVTQDANIFRSNEEARAFMRDNVAAVKIRDYVNIAYKNCWDSKEAKTAYEREFATLESKLLKVLSKPEEWPSIGGYWKIKWDWSVEKVRDRLRDLKKVDTVAEVEDKAKVEEDIWQADVENDDHVPGKEEWNNWWLEEKSTSSTEEMLARISSYKPRSEKPFVLAESTADAHPKSRLGQLWTRLFWFYDERTTKMLFEHGLAAQVAFLSGGPVFYIILSTIPGIPPVEYKKRLLNARVGI